MLYILLLYPFLLFIMLMIGCMRTQHWRKVFWALMFANGLIVLLLVRGSGHSDDRLGIGRLVGMGVVALLIISFATAMGISTVNRLVAARRNRIKKPGSSVSTQTGRFDNIGRPFRTKFASDIAFAAVTGTLVPTILFFPLGVFGRWPGWLVFGILSLGLLWCIFQNLPKGNNSIMQPPPDSFKLFHLALGLTLAGSIAVALYTATTVRREAGRVAQSASYCLQSGAQAAESLLDLSILTFREPYQQGGGAAYLRNHGLLVVGDGSDRRLFNWSYATQTFLADTERFITDPSSRPTIVCTTKRGG